MRILKYLFLLVLLSLVASTIFIATQKGDFLIKRSKIINSPKSSVFDYVNDYRNWASFGSWAAEDPKMKFSYSQKTIGQGASFSWDGKDGDGEMHTVFVKENDSISQKMQYNGSPSTVHWSFKDTIGGTKVSWVTKGKMNFLFKLYTTLNGGIEEVIGTMYEKSLTNLDRALDFEKNTYSVKVNGLIKKNPIYYLGQSFTSKLSKVNKNFNIVIPKISKFCKENNIVINGKPFIIYHTYDTVNQLAKISICLPIKDEILISPGSEIISGKLDSFETVKTTLTGDYDHKKEAYDKAVKFLNKNILTPNSIFSYLEIYTVSKSEIKNPSKWITEIYIPIISKDSSSMENTEEAIDSTELKTVSKPKSNNIEPKKVPVRKKITKVAPINNLLKSTNTEPKVNISVPEIKISEPEKISTPKIKEEESK